MMRRRAFVVGASAALVAPRLVRAQTRARRVALVSGSMPTANMNETADNSSFAPFLRELRVLGLVEGQNAVFERYSALNQAERNEPIAREVVTSRPDLIFVAGASEIIRFVAALTSEIPVVFHTTDALAFGLVPSLAHPGANLTGAQSTAGKEVEGLKLQILRRTLPGARRVAVFDRLVSWAVDEPFVRAAAQQLGFELLVEIVQDPGDEAEYRRVLAAIKASEADAIKCGTSANVNNQLPLIGKLAAELRLPGIAAQPTFVDGGGLMSYGANLADVYRKEARLVARILLDGARAGELPVAMPDTFDLVVSARAAKALGIALPADILLQAAEVRE